MLVVASSWVTIASAFGTPDEAEPAAEAELVALAEVELELLELQAASRAAAAIAPAPVNQSRAGGRPPVPPDARPMKRRVYRACCPCVIAYAFHPTVHAGGVNASFLLRYACTVTKA